MSVVVKGPLPIRVSARDSAASATISVSRGPVGEQGLPGVNAVPADAAVAGYIATPGASATKTALSAAYVAKGAVVVNVADYASVQAALDAAPAGSTVFFPPAVYVVPTGGYALKTTSLTIDAMGAEFQVTAWGTPAFLALRSNGGGDGHTFRVGLVRFTGTRGDHNGTSLRGSAPYASGCGVWANGDRNHVEYLRTIAMPTPIFFSSWDGTSTYDRTGVGNRISYFEAEGYDFGLLYVKQTGFDWGDAYCHDDIDDSTGANPTHALYCSAASGQRAGAGTIGRWTVVNNTHGHAFIVKYADNLTAQAMVAQNCAGVLSAQNVNDFHVGIIRGTSLVASTASRQVEFVGVDVCNRVTVDSIVVDQAAGNDSLPVGLWMDGGHVGAVEVRSNHSASVSGSSVEVQIRGNVGTVDRIFIEPKGTPCLPVGLGDATLTGQATYWSVPNVRAIGTLNDPIPVAMETHCHSNLWGDGSSFLANTQPVRGIYRRGMRWSAASPAVGSARGWVQTVNGALSAATWTASTAVTAGTWWRTSTSKVIRYTVAGTTGATEPAPVTVGGTGADGTATYEYMSATSGTVVSEGNL